MQVPQLIFQAADPAHEHQYDARRDQGHSDDSPTPALFLRGLLRRLGPGRLIFSQPPGNLLQSRQLPVGELPSGLPALLDPQQGAHRNMKQPAHGDELVKLGNGGVRLPLAHRLPGHPQLFSQLLLGKARVLPQSLDPFSQCHGACLLSRSGYQTRQENDHHPPGSFCQPSGAVLLPQCFQRRRLGLLHVDALPGEVLQG